MMEVKRIHRIEVSSTNTYLKELLTAGVDLPELTLVDADFQTGGRGQQGNSWESEREKNLLFSLLCHPTFLPATNQFVLSQAIAVAAQRTLSEYTDGITIKWPNDIYWNDQKICGTLIECNLMGNCIKDCIIGTGINVNQMEFKSDAPNPVSLAQITGFTFNRQTILDSVVQQFKELYEELKDSGVEALKADYMQHLYRREGFYPFQEPNGETFEAEIVDVEPMGHLVLRRRDGSLSKYEFKEIKYIL